MRVKNFNVGPSELFSEAKTFLSEVIKNDSIIVPHRGANFVEMHNHTQEAFKDFFNIPENYSVFFPYSATDAMDIVIEAVVDENITHVSNGTFGGLFIAASKSFQKDVKKLEKKGDTRVSIEQIGTNHDVLCITANDTSTGMQYNNNELQEIRANNPESYLFVDATSSFGAVEYDISLADGWILSVQKNLGLPSGLGVLVINNRSIEKAQQRQDDGKIIGGHNSLLKLRDFQKSSFTPSTPNSLLIAGLGYICEEFSSIFGTIENLDTVTKQKAEYFYNQIEQIEGITPYNKGDGLSDNTFVLEVTPQKLELINKRIAKENYSVSPGLFELEGKAIRIANFPVHSMQDLEALVMLLK